MCPEPSNRSGLKSIVNEIRYACCSVPPNRSFLLQNEVAMASLIHQCHQFIFAITLLSLVTVRTAVAQRKGEGEQDLQSKSLMDVPADLKPPAESTRSALDRWVPPDIDALQLP